MTSFNGVTVISRGGRPSPLIPAKLDFFNYAVGTLTDPFQVCSVHIFPNAAFDSPKSYLNLSAGDPNYGLVSSVATYMLFHNYKRNITGVKVGFDPNVSACAVEADYIADYRNSASGIFKEATGHFSVILQPSGTYWKNSAPGEGWVTSFNNTASSLGGYLDIWTIVQTEGSDAQIYVNTFGMGTANTFATTEPLEVTTTNKLIQRYIELGSTKRLQIQTSIVVDSEPLQQSIRNLIEGGSLLTNPKISITKINQSPVLTSRANITGGDGAFTASGVEIDGNGTISYAWDTSNITPYDVNDILGGGRGIYEVSVKYDVVDETIISPRFNLVVR